ncbi:MAG: TlpA disulfide reductase family protein, partial [Saprospiraceae bacterium]|nr:TlpA disulfide reductase family protein [Saprospiraceae bacterium]
MITSRERKRDRQPIGLLIALILAACVVAGCIRITNEYAAIPPGMWRATLDLTASPVSEAEFDERTQGQLPFNFEVIYSDQDAFHIEVINGEERIVITDIRFGLDVRRGRDTIQIDFPVYGSYIRADYEEDAIEGYWYVPSRGPDYRIPFRALHGKLRRFDHSVAEPTINVDGRWKAMFEVETNDPYPAIGYFRQQGDSLTGTFLTETGDYRFLEGNVMGDRMFLSVFDGAHAFLFEAKQLEDGTLSGIFRSGNHYKTYWSAARSDTFTLRDPYTLTYLNEGYDAFDFTAETLDGETVSLSDARYQGRPKLVQIFGTWCPNCRDETAFLVEYLKKHDTGDLAVIALAFERYRDKTRAREAIRTYQDYFDIPYEVLYAGPSSKSAASELLPSLNRVISYPT